MVWNTEFECAATLASLFLCVNVIVDCVCLTLSSHLPTIVRCILNWSTHLCILERWYCWFAARSRCVHAPCILWIHRTREHSQGEQHNETSQCNKYDDANGIECEARTHKNGIGPIHWRLHVCACACIHCVRRGFYVTMCELVFDCMYVCMDVQFGQTNITVTAHFASNVKNSR